MKKFKFSLQKVLDLRDFELKQAEAELGKVVSKIVSLNNEVQLIAQRRLSTQRTMDMQFDLSTYATGHAYTIFLNQKKEQCLEQIARLQIEADQKRQIVIKAMQKKKALEKLRENSLKHWKEDLIYEEELASDDVVVAKYGTKVVE